MPGDLESTTATLLVAARGLTVAARMWPTVLWQLRHPAPSTTPRGVRDAAGLPIAVGGLVQAPDGALEAWLVVRPGLDAAQGTRLVLMLRRELRLTGRHQAKDRTIRTFVDPANAPGRRLATLLGFAGRPSGAVITYERSVP